MAREYHRNPEAVRALSPEQYRVTHCIDSAALAFVPYDELDARGYGEYQRLFTEKETA